MKPIKLALVALMATAFLLSAGPAQAQKGKKKHPWKTYTAEKFGFSMKVPKGTVFAEKDWKNGWGGVYANYWGVQLWGVSQLGPKHKPGIIETFGVIVTGVPFKNWKIIDKGKKTNGFDWYKVARTEKGKHVAFALYGVGAKGSYLLVLKTTKKSFARDKKPYTRWYRSIKVK